MCEVQESIQNSVDHEIWTECGANGSIYQSKLEALNGIDDNFFR